MVTNRQLKAGIGREFFIHIPTDHYASNHRFGDIGYSLYDIYCHTGKNKVADSIISNNPKFKGYTVNTCLFVYEVKTKKLVSLDIVPILGDDKVSTDVNLNLTNNKITRLILETYWPISPRDYLILNGDIEKATLAWYSPNDDLGLVSRLPRDMYEVITTVEPFADKSFLEKGEEMFKSASRPYWKQVELSKDYSVATVHILINTQDPTDVYGLVPTYANDVLYKHLFVSEKSRQRAIEKWKEEKEKAEETVVLIEKAKERMKLMMEVLGVGSFKLTHRMTRKRAEAILELTNFLADTLILKPNEFKHFDAKKMLEKMSGS